MINKLFNCKMIIVVIVLLLSGGIGAYMFYVTNIESISNMEYRKDTQPLIDRFGDKIDIESCMWKAAIIGNSRLGPSSYWMKGFIIPSDESVQKVEKQYIMSHVDLQFPKGIDPGATGYEDFDWRYNAEFSKEIVGTGFIGDFYIDIKHGILYFDIESN